jgi:alanine racemase
MKSTNSHEDLAAAAAAAAGAQTGSAVDAFRLGILLYGFQAAIWTTRRLRDGPQLPLLLG